MRVTSILLVADDEIDALAVARMFERARIANPLHVARTGGEALAMLRDERVPPGPRLALVDLDLPRASGAAFVRALRGDPGLRAIPVVGLLAGLDDRDRAAAQGLDVIGYLAKPITFGAFAELAGALAQQWTLGAP